MTMDRRDFLCTAGRATIVACVCWLVVGLGREPLQGAVAATVLTLVWAVALQCSLVHSKPLYRDLGPAAATAIGSALGFVVASAF